MDFRCLFVTFFLFTFIYFGSSEEECQNADEDGKCVEPCPVDTFAYRPDCDNITISQRTCRNHEIRTLGSFCDFVRCDCLDDKYWDEAAKKCVLLEECSDQSKVMDDLSSAE